jgi:hypothetical protein
MTAERELTRTVQTWLQDGVSALPDHVLVDVLDQVPAIRQEHGWLAERRSRPVQTSLSLSLAAAAVVALAVAGLTLVPRYINGVGGPLVPSPSTSPSTSPTSTGPTGRVDMQVSGVPVSFTISLPEGWHVSHNTPNMSGFAAIRASTAPPNGMSVSLHAVANTFADPCGQEPHDPVIGPTVDDLVEVLGQIPNTTSTKPVDATLGGLPARYIEMTSDDPLPCSPSRFFVWETPTGGLNGAQGEGQIVRAWIVALEERCTDDDPLNAHDERQCVGPFRIVASALSYPSASAGVLAEQQSILDSIQFFK